MMGKDKRLWRKLVKKLRRQKKRQQLALHRDSKDIPGDGKESDMDEDGDENWEEFGDETDATDTTFFLSPVEWEERRKQSELAFAMKKAEEERRAQIEAENKRKIREEFEVKQAQELKLKEEKERLEKLMKEKQVEDTRGILMRKTFAAKNICDQKWKHFRQEAEFDEFLSFLSGDIETPPIKYLMPDETEDNPDICYYYSKTATCRFYDRCTKSHPRPQLSAAILIPNFFSHFKLEQCVRDEYDSDIGLEYEDSELYKEFLEFYDDVLPEFRKHGTVIQFKVCCNLEPHLRGNVYIQYETIRESVEAFRKFNGRFYNGKQLSLQFIKMNSWRSAICGSFLRKACVKGRTCNFLHVFRNPTKEFVKADHDWKEFQRPNALLPSKSMSVIPNVPSTTCQEETVSTSNSFSAQTPTQHSSPVKAGNEKRRKNKSRNHSHSKDAEEVARKKQKKSKKVKKKEKKRKKERKAHKKHKRDQDKKLNKSTSK